VCPGVGDLSHQARILELVAVYIEVVEWFINVGLLPEFPCEDLALVDDGYEAAGDFGLHRVPYPASALAKIYQRRYMFGLNVVLLNVTCIIFIQFSFMLGHLESKRYLTFGFTVLATRTAMSVIRLGSKNKQTNSMV
jgi:hypothetical protein